KMSHPDRRGRAVLQHGQVRKQAEALKHHVYFTPHVVDTPKIRPKFDAVDDDPAFLKLLERVDAADQRRFTRTRRPANHDALAFTDVEIDVAQHMKITEPLVEIDDADNRIRGHGHFTHSAGARSAGARRT